MRVSASRLGRWWWKRRQASNGQQELVRGVKEIQVCIDGTLCDCEKDRCAARVVDGDIGLKTGSPARLFDDV